MKLSWMILLVLPLLVACGNDAQEQLSAKEIFDKGLAYYEEGEYVRAITEFNNLSYIAAGTEYEDQAKFYLGMSYFKDEKFLLSAESFDLLIRTNPGSDLLPDAYYYKAIAYYKMSPRFELDQTYAIQAIIEFQTFIDYFPTNERVKEALDKIDELRLKLAKKEFQNAKIYMKMEYFKSATVYYQYVIDRYYDTPFAEQAVVGKIESLAKRRKWDDLQIEYAKFLDKYPSSEFREEAKKHYEDGLEEKSRIEKEAKEN